MRFLILFMLLISTSALAAEDASCRATAGRKYAQKLVDQCMMVSAATHPPCNAANSCDMILGFIAGGCRMLSDGTEPLDPNAAIFQDPQIGFCKEFLEIASETQPSFDCKKAASAIEKSICGDQDLSQADAALGRIYALALESEAVTSAEQRVWLKRRDAECGGADGHACLLKMMLDRIQEIQAAERGVLPLANPAPVLAYEDLLGKWEVRAVRLFDYEGIGALSDNDPQYMSAKVEFTADSITWQRGLPENDLDDSDNCVAAPRLLPMSFNPDENSYQVPDAYTMHCGNEPWGPYRGAVIKPINPNLARLYWFDGGILTLKRMP